MNLTVISARLYDCGASIAALRSANALASEFDSVDYLYEEGSALNEVRQVNPAVNITGISPQQRPGRPPFELYEREMERLSTDFVILHNFDHDFDTVARFGQAKPTLWMMHDASPVTGLHYAMPSYDGRSIVRYESRKGVPTRSFFERIAKQRFGFAAPSLWLKKIAEYYLCGETPVHLVRNSVPTAYFRPRDKALARAIVGADPDAFVVLFFAGRGAMERKNLHLLMKALEYIPDPRLQVLVIGGLPARHSRVDPRCLFLPNFSQQRDPVRPSLLYSAADLFLLPSLIDNLPNTVLESYFCGTPVMATRDGGTKEMLIENETGWLIDARSPVDVATKLSEAMKDKALSRFGERGRAFVGEHFSEEVSRSQYLTAIESVQNLAAGRTVVAVPPSDPVPTAAVTEPIYAPEPAPISFNDAVAIHRQLNPDSHIAVYRDKWNPTPLQKRWLTTCYRMAGSGHAIRSNEERIARWRNVYKGKRAFLIGNGPSLNRCDLSYLRDEITIGVNSIFLKADELGGLPTHYVVEDFFVAEDRAEQINALTGTTKWFGNYLKYCLDDDDAHWLNVRMRYDNYKNFPFFSTDASRQVWAGGSVTFICMQLAFFFGIKELYLIGFDHHYVIPDTTDIDGGNLTSLGDDPNHFDKTYFGKGLRWHDPKTERMELGYSKAGLTFERHGRKIYNATVGGKLEVLERRDYQSIFGPGSVR
ncbi:glycosyltransferase [Rhizobium sp. TRM95111]|uniref:glycosyltransferase n=1 Tax=Rhizobium alarense TaxID=2846851 RepID=UPI001F399288|nr:glycosyltransferase [Rhizobium alarense]MCF3640128.1 glycosyltransferase [Rhizobium alarense]